MNYAERVDAIFSFDEPDQVPVVDWGYWDEIFERWPEEGLPQELVQVPEGDFIPGVDLRTVWGEVYKRKVRTHQMLNYFGAEPWLAQLTLPIYGGIYPFFEEEVLEEREHTLIVRNRAGVVLQKPKHGTSFPGFIEFPVKTQADYEALRATRLDPDTPGRYVRGWDTYARKLMEQNRPLVISLTGFFGFPRNLMGLENLAMAYYLDPDLVQMMVEDHCAFVKQLLAPALDQFPIRFALIWEDMAYNHGSLVSPETFHEFMTPYYLEVTDFLRQKGVEHILVDSDGNIVELSALFIEAGVDGVYPLEIASGSDPVVMRERYPDLVMVGGIDKRVLTIGPEAIKQELERVVPVVEKGGYLPMLDHLVPSDVPLANYEYYLQCARELF